MQFLSDEWANAYTSLLNENEIIQKKLKRFTSLFKYEVSDREDLKTLVIEVTKGKCTSFGSETAFNAKDIEFSMSANADTWQKIFNKEIGIKEAVKNNTFKIDGPKFKALSNKTGLEKSARIMLDMESIKV